MTDRRRPILKSPGEIEAIASVGAIVASALAAAERLAGPGVTPRALNDVAEAVIRETGAVPTFLGFQPTRGVPPYPAATCVSLNDVIVHGIPGDRPLSSGDLVSIDCAARLDGWNADSAITIAIGSPSLDDARLIAAAHDALDAGVAATVAEGTIGDIAAAVERRARVDGLRPLANLTGHGIGQAMWEPPLVPNAGPAGSGRRLEVGLVIAIEPMLTEGSVDSVIDSNGWSIRTADGARAAHVEHTVALTEDGPRVLTTT